ncbi:putative Ser/Thr protein phosphatase family [Paratrimastix pyriformis]|uniref:Ser/Thr protein phosphatase family n=1 Tax=Paratrimastix pyriformis TaxID=342808 RepID=A0ABQ8UA07_9EUKA|nr:putative Ser/Thr protein phosphatase family [Paratrimastix pyriformis]
MITDSVQKLESVLELCQNIDVKTTPENIDGLWVVPLFSWYDGTLGTAQDVITPQDREVMKSSWADFHYCKWPQHYSPMELYERNESFISTFDAEGMPVVSFSHMVPRRDLLPSSQYLQLKFLPHLSGATRLEQQIRRIHSHTHVFAHSHINAERTFEGVRYIQNALGYPRERERWGLVPHMVQVWPPQPPEMLPSSGK